MRNWCDPNLPHVLAEPVVEEMVKARDRVKAGRKVRTDKLKRGWPKRHLGYMVRGQHPKTKEWSMKFEGMEIGHGERSVNVALEDNSSRLFMREDVRLDSTKKYQEAEEEGLNTHLVGMGLEARNNHKLMETMRRPRKAKQAPNTDQGEPKRSSRLAGRR